MNKYEFLVNGILHVIEAASLYMAMQILNEDLGIS
jgi:hypothetical protein